MAGLLRISLFCICMMAAVHAARADDYAFITSEQELAKAYSDAIKIVQKQNPTLLPALQKEQEDWMDHRFNECTAENKNLPKEFDKQKAMDFCKANMNRKRTNVLRGKRPNGKDW